MSSDSPAGHTVVFDVGKTNKKTLVFDGAFEVVEERSVELPRAEDEDGHPCDDLALLDEWLREEKRRVLARPEFDIVAMNASGYGASFVHLGVGGEPVLPLYDYLKPLPADIEHAFLETHGPKEHIAVRTASPWMGMLNSGLQLYWLGTAHLDRFSEVSVSLHLPQYLAYRLGHPPADELTSLGCHTMLWDFESMDYAGWVHAEGIASRFPRRVPTASHVDVDGVRVGPGVHDSSAALVPYLRAFGHEPFVLLSTGTWSIALNPFSTDPLTPAELAQDVLCYLSPEGQPVKAARLFLGNEHAHQTERLAAHFERASDTYKTVTFDEHWAEPASQWPDFAPSTLDGFTAADSDPWPLDTFTSYEEAYHALVHGLVTRQLA
ncbi:MAG: carbohydrate kinase, partial [Bacteroidota bacterium]